MKGSAALKSKRHYKMLRQGTRCLGDFSVRDFRRAFDAADQAASHIWKLEAVLPKCRSCNKAATRRLIFRLAETPGQTNFDFLPKPRPALHKRAFSFSSS